MEVVTLGTGSPIPDANRAGAATLGRAGNATLLSDCGRAVVMRLGAAGVFPPMLTQLLITHLHSDHINNFNDVLTTRWIMSPVDNPLPVIGPPGTAAFVDQTIAMLKDDIHYRLEHHNDLNWNPSCTTQEITSGVAWEAEGVRVTAAPTDHRPVSPSIGFRIEADGAVVAIAGDTIPCAGLDEICAGADIYVQTVLRPELIKAVPSPRLQDVLDYHSTCAQAGATAARAGVKTLVLTHLVPAPAPGTESEWIAEAASEFAGEIIVAADLQSIST